MLPAAAWTALPCQSEALKLADAKKHLRPPPLGVNTPAASLLNLAQKY